MTRPAKTLEFWYEFASTYSYLSALRIETLARKQNVSIVYKPFLLGPIFRAQGWQDSPFNIYPAKGNYMWRDMERRCKKYGLPFKKPSRFPRNGLLAARLALLGGQDWAADFTRRVYTAEFSQDLDIGDERVLRSVLEKMGRDAEALLALAQGEPCKSDLRKQTEHAAALGIFGAPSFLSAGELYWGDDRLEDALTQETLKKN